MFHNAALKRTSLTPYDWGLVFATLGLLMIGLVMVYSASIATAEAKSAANQPAFYLIRHSMYLVIGLGCSWPALSRWSWCWFRSSAVKSMAAGAGFRSARSAIFSLRN